MANKVTNFFKEIRTEMGKVAWPTRDELIGSTAVVLISLGILATFIGICDLALSTVINIIMTRI